MNAYPGWYSHFGEIERGVDFFRGLLRATRAAHPATPLVLTEFGADAVAGLHSCPALMFTEEYQVEVIMAIIGVLHEPEFEQWVINGCVVWNFADFATTANTMRVVGNPQAGVFHARPPARWPRPRCGCAGTGRGVGHAVDERSRAPHYYKLLRAFCHPISIMSPPEEQSSGAKVGSIAAAGALTFSSPAGYV